MKFFDTDTHEIFEASAADFQTALDDYHDRVLREQLRSTPIMFMPAGPVLRGHRHFVYKFDEEYVMIKFEDKFVHFRWTDELEGKRAFYGDSINQLEMRAAITTSLGHLHKSTSKEYPFEIEGAGNWRFIYYDPNYDCKVAYNEGKQIQVKQGIAWVDVTGEPEWFDRCEYRIKPDDSYAVVIKEDKLSFVHIKNITCQHVFFRGSQDECHNYIASHAKFTECMIAYLDNKQIQVKQPETGGWEDIDDPVWEDSSEYRIKPGLTWTDLKLGDTVRQFNGYIASMVTAFDTTKDASSHVQISGWGWVSDSELAEKWTKI